MLRRVACELASCHRLEELLRHQELVRVSYRSLPDESSETSVGEPCHPWRHLDRMRHEFDPVRLIHPVRRIHPDHQFRHYLAHRFGQGHQLRLGDQLRRWNNRRLVDRLRHHHEVEMDDRLVPNQGADQNLGVLLVVLDELERQNLADVVHLGVRHHRLA